MGANQQQQHHSFHLLNKKRLIAGAIYCLIPLALLHFYFFPVPSYNPPVLAPQSEHNKVTIPFPSATGRSSSKTRNNVDDYCDYSDGEWIPDDRPPVYNGTTCTTIKEGQNCMLHGRPDTAYLRWRWRSAVGGCRVPLFKPRKFLKLIQNKHLAFVGDSMARNQLESLLCLLSSASPARLVYSDGEEKRFRRWVFDSHNSTVSVFWSPFLVKGVEKNPATGLDHNELFVDVADQRWASQLTNLDMVVFSVGHWFLHPALYYEHGVLLGCHHCPGTNHTEIGFFTVLRKAVRTALHEVVRQRSPAVAVVTTFSPAHFEGEWDKPGACAKKVPYKAGEKEMEYMDREMRNIEVEEVAAAAAEAAAAEVKVKVVALDVTKLALMRADGHPGPYMNPNPFADGPKEKVQNDCVHWCLPGPIDTWNEILLQMMNRWEAENRL